jgi:hypothetical protein
VSVWARLLAALGAVAAATAALVVVIEAIRRTVS